MLEKYQLDQLEIKWKDRNPEVSLSRPPLDNTPKNIR